MSSLQLDGLPHSDSVGSIRVCQSPTFFAAFRVLLRSEKPRHPPFALCNFFFSRDKNCSPLTVSPDLSGDPFFRLNLFLLPLLSSLSLFQTTSHFAALALLWASIPLGGPSSAEALPRDSICQIKTNSSASLSVTLQKGGVPATPSGTATLLRLSPSYRFCPRSLLAVTNFRHPQLPWLDGRCVQGPGTYSPRHG